MTKKLLLPLALIILSGCAENWTWYKIDTSHAERGRDFEDCRRDARWNGKNYLAPLAGAFGPAFATSSEQEAIFEYCLRLRGYDKYTYEQIAAMEGQKTQK